MEINRKKISGLSLLEALVSTAIIGIGFVAILQMTTYSVQSINTSGDRTKANYLTNMMAEDVIGHKNVNTSGVQNFSEYLSQNQPDLDFCDNPAQQTATTAGNVYGSNDSDGALMKSNKWKAILNSKAYLSCKGSDETRNFQVSQICSTSSSCNLKNDQTDEDNRLYVNDQHMYIGRIQMNLNDGNKIKYLYFQTDYKLKE